VSILAPSEASVQTPPARSPWQCDCRFCLKLPARCPSVPRDYPEHAHEINSMYRRMRAAGASIPSVLRDEWVFLSECIELEAAGLYRAALEVADGRD
jgi:hypothetical protein